MSPLEVITAALHAAPAAPSTSGTRARRGPAPMLRTAHTAITS
ncbi:hypothetical protein BX265_8394 [Streptomyces sp. TLI_235]|nr:hypothetical protein BX265_8394 [Streptomyces sp. TLI_235]